MSKGQVNRKIWVHRSHIPVRSMATRNLGYIFWKEEKVNGLFQCRWKGHEFLAEDWHDMLCKVDECEGIEPTFKR